MFVSTNKLSRFFAEHACRGVEVAQHGISVPPPYDYNGIGVDLCEE